MHRMPSRNPARRRIVGACLAVPAVAALAPSRAAEAHVLKIAAVQAAEHPFMQGASRLAELVETKTGGRIKGKIYPSGTLGGDQQVISSLQGGTVEMTIVSAGTLASIDRHFNMFYLPMTFDRGTQVDAVVDSAFGRSMLERVQDKGLIGLTWFDYGFRHVTNVRRPLTRLEDFQGLKLRVLQVPIFIDIYNGLGANAVPMPFPELYTALETRAVDGQENPITTVETAKFYEVQKHLSLTGIVYDPLVVLISRKTWERLSKDDQQALRESATESTAFQRTRNREVEAKVLETLRGKGMAVNDVAPAERQRMREHLKPVHDKHAKTFDPAVLEAFTAEVKKARG